MHKPLLIVMLICFNSSEILWAQWTEKDSVWLQNILSGKEKLELNPETKKAIESGSLINLGEPASHMKFAPTTKLPVSKDFSEYIQNDSSQQKIALKDLPTYVFWHYAPKPIKPLKVYESIIDEFKRNPMQKTGGFFSIADMTSRKEFIHKRNAKRDGTWREYNNLPTPDIIKKRKTLAKTDSLLQQEKDSILALRDSLCLRDSIIYQSPDQGFPITGLDSLINKF